MIAARDSGGGEVLFLAHRVPFPPDRGDRIRSCHLLRRIAELAPVHVGCFAETAADLKAEAELAQISASHCLLRRTRPLPLAALDALVRGRPVSVSAFAALAMRDFVARVLAERPIGAIFVFSGQMAQYLPERFDGPVVMDFVDVDSAKFEAYAAQADRLRGWLYRREARLLSRLEDAVAHRVDTSLFVSAEEAALFRSRMVDPAGAHVVALGNGIDTARFDPDGSAVEPGLAGEGPQLVFTGQMDYPPNVAAVTFFARQVMPRLLAQRPECRFHIVGRAPVAAVRALDGVDGTRVTGEVADVRPWLAGASCVVAPLQIARGVQNKVLEAMAMARPVVLTPAAATGIGGRDGEHFVLAEDADGWARQVLALLEDPARAARLGQAARRFVCGHAGWDKALAPLPQLLGLHS